MPMGIIENRRRSALIFALGKTAGTLTMCSRIYTITWLRISDKWGPAHMYICICMYEKCARNLRHPFLCITIYCDPSNPPKTGFKHVDET